VFKSTPKKHPRNPYVAALFRKITLVEPDSTDMTQQNRTDRKVIAGSPAKDGTRLAK
jgi:hypothetical protein